MTSWVHMQARFGRVRPLRRAADAARDAGRWQDAARLYQAYVATPSGGGDAPIWVQLGHARKEAGDLLAALHAYIRATALAPGWADGQLELGHALRRLGALPAARDAYRTALRCNPGLDAARRSLHDLDAANPAPPAPAPQPAPTLAATLAEADAARDSGEWTLAAALYEQVLAPPGAADPAIWVQLGHARKEAGHADAALAAYRTSLALDPTIADTHLQLGHGLKLMGALSRAAAAYREALRLDPAIPGAQRELDWLAGSLRDRPTAIPDPAAPPPPTRRGAGIELHSTAVETALSRRIPHQPPAEPRDAAPARTSRRSRSGELQLLPHS